MDTRKLCEGILKSPALSDAAMTRLVSVGVDWVALFSLMKTYGIPLVVTALETVIPMLPVGAVWQQLLEALIAQLAKALEG